MSCLSRFSTVGDHSVTKTFADKNRNYTVGFRPEKNHSWVSRLITLAKHFWCSDYENFILVLNFSCAENMEKNLGKVSHSNSLLNLCNRLDKAGNNEKSEFFIERVRVFSCILRETKVWKFFSLINYFF
jgi:hypothetical protein